jgi:predicted GNAT family N-acyltransferase
MWALKLNEVPQGYFHDIKDAQAHATKMFGQVNFEKISEHFYTATIPSRGNVTVTIEFEED